jgi:hypothetical protein
MYTGIPYRHAANKLIIFFIIIMAAENVFDEEEVAKVILPMWLNLDNTKLDDFVTLAFN